VSLISYSHSDPCPLSYHVPDAGTCHVAPGRIVRTAVATTASTRARPSSLASALKNFQAGPSNRGSRWHRWTLGCWSTPQCRSNVSAHASERERQPLNSNQRHPVKRPTLREERMGVTRWRRPPCPLPPPLLLPTGAPFSSRRTRMRRRLIFAFQQKSSPRLVEALLLLGAAGRC
jgi:hypothetical protein